MSLPWVNAKLPQPRRAVSADSGQIEGGRGRAWSAAAGIGMFRYDGGHTGAHRLLFLDRIEPADGDGLRSRNRANASRRDAK